MTKLDSLRQNGYRVHINHFRNYDLYQILTEDSLATIHEIIPLYDVAVKDVPKEYRKFARPRGGRTVVNITSPDGKEVHGIAVCSEKDAFNKKLSLKIALGRAISHL